MNKKNNFAFADYLPFIGLVAMDFLWAIALSYYLKVRFYVNDVGLHLIAFSFLFFMILIADTYPDGKISENMGKGAIVIFIVFSAYCAILIAEGSDIFRSKEYYEISKNMVTVVEDNEEISAFPNLLGENNDTSNLPLIGIPEAIKKAETEMGKIPALGSQFALKEKRVTSQNINGSLCYVIPLEPKNFLKWNDNGNHGYYIVDRNNGNTTFVEDSLITTQDAPFGANAKRIINEYLNSIRQEGLVTDISPEVDDEGKFHYIATVYTKKHLIGIKEVVGIVDLDAQTKDCKFYNLDEIPAFVDRVFPEEFFDDYISFYGKYKMGYWNSLLAQKEVLVPTSGSDVIYIDGICYYYTGFTTAGSVESEGGESSNGIMMMNSRTGEIEYHVTYGISESKAKGVAEGKVQEKGYVASYPLLLEVAGEETYFMLMRDKNNNLCGYAFVNYKDYTKAAVGENLLTTQAAYIKSLSENISGKTLSQEALSTKTGTIESVTSEVIDGNTIYYVKINDCETVFSMFSGLNIDVVFAREGDSVTVSYIDTNEKVIAAMDAVFERATSSTNP